MWVEFYEDYFEQHPNEAMEVSDGENVRFVTGDSEIDDLEKRIAEDSITPEEIDQILGSWIGEKPKQVKQERDRAVEIVEMEKRLQDEVGEGFNDSR